MMGNDADTAVRRHPVFHRYAGAVVASVGVLVLIGWATGTRALTSVHPSLATMKANTSLSFVLLGVALWLRPRRVVLSIAAAIPALIGTLTLVEYVASVNLHIDEVLVRDLGGGPDPGRMSPMTAASFVAAGLALVLIANGRIIIPQALALGVGSAGLVALLGYLYGVEALYHIGPYSSMAVHTASLFILVAVGILSLTRASGIVRVMTAGGVGAVMVRRLLPVVILVPIAVGELVLAGQRVGLYGTEFRLAIFVSSLVITLGGIVWYAASRVDSADVRLEHERAATRRLAELDELKNEFVGIVAHDLRSPLSVIKGFTEIMLTSWDSLPDPDKLGFLEAMSRNSDRMATLIDDVLEVSQIESGDVTFRPEVVDLGRAVRAICDDLAASSGRQLVVRVDAMLPSVKIDTGQHWRILSNLVSNAMKFSREDQPVDVIVSSVGSDVRVSVKDRGPGIAPKDLPMLFRRFSRVGDRSVGGTGLGLYIAKRLVEAQGGRIRVASTQGSGTTFTYSFPARSSPADVTTPDVADAV